MNDYTNAQVIIERIVELLDGKLWDFDTLPAIADTLREAGYQIRDIDFGDEE